MKPIAATKRGLLLLLLLLGSCAGAPREQVTQEMWLDASMQAERLSDGALQAENGRSTIIWHMPIEEIRAMARRYAKAAAYRPGVVYFDEGRPWQSDRVHHFGIVIHEAAHSLQPRTMSPGCREQQAHAVQIAWLVEQRAWRLASDVARHAARHVYEE